MTSDGRAPVSALLTSIAASLFGDDENDRAADVGPRTGAMVALLPSAADAERLAVAGGEPVDQLHLTLLYLGKADTFTPEVRKTVSDAVAAAVGDLPAITVDGFAVAMFNPAGPEPCIVLEMSGEALEEFHDGAVEAALAAVADLGMDLPRQHAPWIPHVTLVLTDDATQVVQLVDRTGPVVFDRVRVAFAAEHIDIPLATAARGAEPDGARFDLNQPRDGDGRWTDGGSNSGGWLTGQGALDAAPATLTPDPNGHGGHYENASLDGPDGMGSAAALSAYEGVEYESINTALRGGRSSDATIAPTVADIDQSMAASRLTSDVQVQRAIRDGRSVFGNAWYDGVVNWDEPDLDVQDRQFEQWEAGARPDLTGLSWLEKGYVSTTADPRIATDVYAKRWTAFNSPLDGEPIVLTINVPQGTGAVQLSPMGKEAEILLERDLTIRVTADNGVDGDGIRQLDATVTKDPTPSRAVAQPALSRAADVVAMGAVPADAADRAEERLTADYPVPLLSDPTAHDTVSGPVGIAPVRPVPAAPEIDPAAVRRTVGLTWAYVAVGDEPDQDDPDWLREAAPHLETALQT